MKSEGKKSNQTGEANNSRLNLNGGNEENTNLRNSGNGKSV